jgi:hypothetical protein
MIRWLHKTQAAAQLNEFGLGNETVDRELEACLGDVHEMMKWCRS